MCDRKNFDSLLWSLVTVFQVIIIKSWFWTNQFKIILIILNINYKINKQENQTFQIPNVFV